MLVGVIAQKYHLPGKFLRWTISIPASLRTEIISSAKDIIDLRVRDLAHADQPRKFHTINYIEEIPISQIALILIDVWAIPSNEAKENREMKQNIHTKLLPLIETARKHHILIVHSPHGRQIYKLVKALPDEVVVDGPQEQAQLIRVLRRRGIKHLLYAGYASNMCILSRPTGIIEMNRFGYKIIFVRDASLPAKVPQFLERELIHEVVVSMVEWNWGGTTTVDDVLDALKQH